MSAIEKGSQRYSRFKRDHLNHFGAKFSGRLLDFGCGAGAFVISALQDKVDVHGIEVEPTRRDQFILNSEKYEPRAANRISLYPGRLMPYPSNYFDGCYSWFVFEHVPEPQVSLREIVRVIRPGGTLTLFAEDARNRWDGHSNTPWPPYLPREFAAAYLEGLGIPHHADFITKSVVYISTPVVVDILQTLGMEVVYSNDQPQRDPFPDGLYVTNNEQARALGEKMRARGAFESPKENLTVFARKPGARASIHSEATPRLRSFAGGEEHQRPSASL